jgi:hypothetical protein
MLEQRVTKGSTIVSRLETDAHSRETQGEKTSLSLVMKEGDESIDSFSENRSHSYDQV